MHVPSQAVWTDSRLVELNSAQLTQILTDADVFVLADMVRALPSNLDMSSQVLPSYAQLECPWGRDTGTFACYGAPRHTTKPNTTDAQLIRSHVLEVLGTHAAEELSHRLSVNDTDYPQYDAVEAFVAATTPSASSHEKAFQLGQLAAVELNEWLRLW